MTKSEYYREWRRANKEKVREYRQRYYGDAENRAHKREHDRAQKRQRYCCEPLSNVENYEKAMADNFNGWHIHHRYECHDSNGERRLVDLSRAELKALGMYWNRPASELIWMTEAEHIQLHKSR